MTLPLAFEFGNTNNENILKRKMIFNGTNKNKNKKLGFLCMLWYKQTVVSSVSLPAYSCLLSDYRMLGISIQGT